MNNDFTKLIQKAEQDMARMEGAYKAKCSEVARLTELIQLYEAVVSTFEVASGAFYEMPENREQQLACEQLVVALAAVRAAKEKV